MAAEGVSVEVLEREGADLVRVTGSIDAKTTPMVAQAIEPALATNRHLVLDLSGVDYVSSAGLRLLLIAYRKLKEESRALVLAGVSDDIQRVMSHTGFLAHFTLAASEADAFRTLAGS